MELTLHVELTQEQYDDLMARSFDAITNRSEVKQALSNIIISNMKDYLDRWFEQNGQDCVYKIFHISDYSWDRNKAAEDLTKQLVMETSEKYKDHIHDHIVHAMQKMIEKVPLEKIVASVLTQYIVKGVFSGMKEWTEQVSVMGSQIESNFNNLKGVLTNPDILQTIYVPPYGDNPADTNI